MLSSASTTNQCVRRHGLRLPIVLLVGVCAAFGARLLLLPQNIGKKVCPSTVAYCGFEHDSFRNALYVYSGASGIRKIMRTGEDNEEKLLGYDVPTSTWVFLKNRDHDTSMPASIICANETGKKSVQLIGLPQKAVREDTELCGGKVFIPCEQNGALVLYCYTLDGKPAGKQRFSPAEAGLHGIDDCQLVDVSKRGYVAVRMDREVRDDSAPNVVNVESCLIVFDKFGRLVRKLDGNYECFSSDGSSLAYRCADKNNDYVVIIDLKGPQAHTRKVITVSRPGCAGVLERAAMEGLSDFRWDSQNQWLFCTYTSGSLCYVPVYAADISTGTPKWQKLPIEVYRDWVMLDKMPEGTGN